MDPTTATAQRHLSRILVVKLADLGDAILATSAIGAVRKRFPYARIDVLTAGAGEVAFRLCPAIDHIITIDKHAFDHPSGLIDPRNAAPLIQVAGRLHQTRYDAVILLHHLTTSFGATKFRWLCRAVGAPIRAGLDNGRGSFLTHRATDFGFGAKSVHDYGLDVVSLLGADVTAARPAIGIPDAARDSSARLIEEHNVGNEFVVIHPSVGEFSQARNWFPDRFASVATSIMDRFDVSVVLVGAGDSTDVATKIRQKAPVIDLTGKTSFGELAAVLDRARVVIGADSGVVHLAAALDRPTIAIFGPSNHLAWKPFGAKIIEGSPSSIPLGNTFVVRSGLPCSPCFYTGYALGRKDGCAVRTCLGAVSAHQVTQIATKILGRTDAPKSTNS